MVEGVEMLVCTNCADMGQPVPSRKSYRRDVQRTPKQRTDDFVFRKAERTRSKTGPRYDEGNLEVMDGYGALLRRIREKEKLTQKELADQLHIKESLLKKLEAESVKPTIRLAQKIERAFNVKILKEIDEEDPVITPQDKPKKIGAPTLGDMIVIKKKKKKSDK